MVQPVVQPVVQQPQVVFLQPLVSRQSSRASKDLSSRHRRSKSYLPILKSYPKIAPHPGDGSGSGSSGRGTASSSSSTSSSFSGSEQSTSQPCQRDKQQKGIDGASSFSSSTPAVPSSPSTVPHSRLDASTSSTSIRENPSSAGSQADLTSSVCFSPASASTSGSLPVAQVDTQENTQVQPDLSENSADIKRKRFCNTYNILSKSGLLDIALRTKELHRQNRRTQTELEQLKEQTDLFLQALYSGDSSLCVKLQARLQEGGGSRDGETAAPTGSKTDKS